jgi:hypothetical protein
MWTCSGAVYVPNLHGVDGISNDSHSTGPFLTRVGIQRDLSVRTPITNAIKSLRIFRES